jgi:hypothetical protein
MAMNDATHNVRETIINASLAYELHGRTGSAWRNVFKREICAMKTKAGRRHIFLSRMSVQKKTQMDKVVSTLLKLS